MSIASVEAAIERGELNTLDARLSELLVRLGRVKEPALALLFARLSHALSAQHSCIDLAADPADLALKDALAELPIVSETGDRTPLVLDGHRLYLQRYFQYETEIAARLIAMNQRVGDPDPTDYGNLVARLFEGTTGAGQQRLAVLQAMTHRLTIVTGGPGTGKTTTVARIIDAIGQSSATPPVIKLAAPTGKAAMRMKESLTLAGSITSPEVLTLHRLLGVSGNGRRYRYNEHHTLPLDLLVVDEVSMIDLAMMHRLLLALPAHARLVMLGDPDQLPSVEAGNILADICKYPTDYSPAFAQFARDAIGAEPLEGDGSHGLVDAVCHLEQSYRFSPDRGIGRLSAAIRAGERVERLDDDEVRTLPLADFTTRTALDTYGDYLAMLTGQADPAELLDAFEKVRILSPAREGDHGVAGINRDIEAALADNGVIVAGQHFYHGRPILITRNDYNLRLFNGDTGICIARPGKSPEVVFRDAGGEIRTHLASRLPPHETCFAMTVHKSQGSEFDDVILVLPDATSDATRQMMTRELVYTAITRARRHVSLYFNKDTFNECLERRSLRHSGLGERLARNTSGA